MGLRSRSSCGAQPKTVLFPPSLTMLPLVQNPSPECRVAGVVQLEPTIMTTGDRWLPHPAGHVTIKGVKELVHHSSGPACAFVGVEHPLKGFGGTLILEAGGTARRLEPAEVVRAQGVETDLYLAEVQQHGQDRAHLHLAREPGWQDAASVIGFLEAVPLDGKAGNCIDPADEEAHSQMAVWLQAWKPAPLDPQSQLTLIPRHQARHISLEEPTAHVTSEARCGGSAPKGELTSFKHRNLVKPAFCRVEACAPDPAVMSKLADSTRRAYTTGWKQWTMFMSGTGRAPFLTGETRAEKQVDEAWLIRFVVFLHEVMGRTIKQRLSAIRYAHIATGHADPLPGRVRLWASLQGLARWESAPDRKVPVTPVMLSWLKRYLSQSAIAECEKAATWAAICTGWFFMFRACEYLPPTDPNQASRRVIRGCDLTFYLDGAVVPLFQAQSVSLQLRECKTDQQSFPARANSNPPQDRGGDLSSRRFESTWEGEPPLG